MWEWTKSKTHASSLAEDHPLSSLYSVYTVYNVQSSGWCVCTLYNVYIHINHWIPCQFDKQNVFWHWLDAWTLTYQWVTINNDKTDPKRYTKQKIQDGVFWREYSLICRKTFWLWRNVLGIFTQNLCKNILRGGMGERS